MMYRYNELVNNRYLISWQLGQRVWLANDTVSGQDVVLKELREEETPATCLRHPYIVQYLGTFEEQGRKIVIHSFAEGESVDQKDSISMKEALSWCICICEALIYARTMGLTHTDIKKSNLVAVSEYDAVLTDLEAFAPCGEESEDIKAIGRLFYQMLKGEGPMDPFALEDLPAAVIADRCLHGEITTLRQLRMAFKGRRGDTVLRHETDDIYPEIAHAAGQLSRRGDVFLAYEPACYEAARTMAGRLEEAGITYSLRVLKGASVVICFGDVAVDVSGHDVRLLRWPEADLDRLLAETRQLIHEKQQLLYTPPVRKPSFISDILDQYQPGKRLDGRFVVLRTLRYIRDGLILAGYDLDTSQPVCFYVEWGREKPYSEGFFNVISYHLVCMEPPARIAEDDAHSRIITLRKGWMPLESIQAYEFSPRQVLTWTASALDGADILAKNDCCLEGLVMADILIDQHQVRLTAVDRIVPYAVNTYRKMQQDMLGIFMSLLRDGEEKTFLEAILRQCPENMAVLVRQYISLKWQDS